MKPAPEDKRRKKARPRLTCAVVSRSPRSYSSTPCAPELISFLIVFVFSAAIVQEADAQV